MIRFALPTTLTLENEFSQKMNDDANWGGGRNVEFHYYDWSFFLQRQNCLLSSSLLRQKSDFRCSDFTYGVKKDHNVENQNTNYLPYVT